MTVFDRDGSALEVRHLHEVIRVEPWGTDSVRLRAANGSIPPSDVGALGEPPASSANTTIVIDGGVGRLVNGALTVEIQAPAATVTPTPTVRFSRTDTGVELLAEKPEHFWWPGARLYEGGRRGPGAISQQFQAYDGERLFGMGQRTHGRLDHKGLALDLVHRNAEVSIPFVLSNRGYGLLWNNPATGRVEFAENVTRWTATQARAIDYFVTTGTPVSYTHLTLPTNSRV